MPSTDSAVTSVFVKGGGAVFDLLMPRVSGEGGEEGKGEGLGEGESSPGMRVLADRKLSGEAIFTDPLTTPGAAIHIATLKVFLAVGTDTSQYSGFSTYANPLGEGVFAGPH